MKNFEKYEQEIKGLKTDGDLYKQLKHLTNDEYELSWGLHDLVNWFYEDYKEPLLTDEEKEYLNNVIKPYRIYIDRIWKINAFLTIHMTKNYEGYTIKLPTKAENEMFKKLIIDEEYSLEELGL